LAFRPYLGNSPGLFPPSGTRSHACIQRSLARLGTIQELLALLVPAQVRRRGLAPAQARRRGLVRSLHGCLPRNARLGSSESGGSLGGCQSMHASLSLTWPMFRIALQTGCLATERCRLDLLQTQQQSLCSANRCTQTMVQSVHAARTVAAHWYRYGKAEDRLASWGGSKFHAASSNDFR